MPLSFFKSPAKEELINQRITSIKSLLSASEAHAQQLFLNAFEQRVQEFKFTLSEELDEKQVVLEQYNRFTKTLYCCVKQPHFTEYYSDNYLNINYFPIGLLDMEPRNPLLVNTSIIAITLGLLLLAGSIPAFIFNPVLGIIAVASAISLAMPAAYILSLSSAPNVGKKKAEDKKLFLAAASLLVSEHPQDDEAYYDFKSFV